MSDPGEGASPVFARQRRRQSPAKGSASAAPGSPPRKTYEAARCGSLIADTSSSESRAARAPNERLDGIAERVIEARAVVGDREDEHYFFLRAIQSLSPSRACVMRRS